MRGSFLSECAAAGTIRLRFVSFRRALESAHRRVHLRLAGYRRSRASCRAGSLPITANSSSATRPSSAGRSRPDPPIGWPADVAETGTTLRRRALRTRSRRALQPGRSVPRRAAAYPLPADELIVDDEPGGGSRGFLSGPLEFGPAMLITPSCSLSAQGAAGYGHPVRTLVPLIPLSELLGRGIVKETTLADLRGFDHLINYGTCRRPTSSRLVWFYSGWLEDDLHVFEPPMD
jgi:hypothetical protein